MTELEKFAWYIYKGNQIIEKIPYSKSNSINYVFKNKGSYRIKYYIKKGNDSISRLSEKILI